MNVKKGFWQELDVKKFYCMPLKYVVNIFIYTFITFYFQLMVVQVAVQMQ